MRNKKGKATRRWTLSIGLIVVLFVLASGLYVTPVNAQIKLTYANFPPATTFPCIQMERWAKEVEKRTNGKVKVITFPGSSLLGPKNMFDGVRTGLADIGCLTLGYQPGRFPLSEAADLPIGMPSAKVASMVLYDLVEKYKPKEFEDIKILTMYSCAPSNFMTRMPVRSIKDLKGAELRVVGTAADVLKLLGGTPIAMPQSDTPEALQRGVVRGVVSSLEVLKDLNYAAYCPYVTFANLQTFGFVVCMNKKKWEGLPADVKRVLDNLSRDQALWTGQYADDHCKEALEWSSKKYGLQVFEFSAADKAEIPKLVKPFVDGYAKRVTADGMPGDQIVKDVYRLKAKYAQEFK